MVLHRAECVTCEVEKCEQGKEGGNDAEDQDLQVTPAELPEGSLEGDENKKATEYIGEPCMSIYGRSCSHTDSYSGKQLIYFETPY